MQITLRVTERLAEELRAEAQRCGRSLNGLLTWAAETLVDPSLIDDEREQFRAKLRKAGILVELPRLQRKALPPEERERLRNESFPGQTLSDIVIEGRGPR